MVPAGNSALLGLDFCKAVRWRLEAHGAGLRECKGGPLWRKGSEWKSYKSDWSAKTCHARRLRNQVLWAYAAGPADWEHRSPEQPWSGADHEEQGKFPFFTLRDARSTGKSKRSQCAEPLFPLELLSAGGALRLQNAGARPGECDN